MGKVMARFKRVMVTLQTGWSILGITLIILLVVEARAALRFCNPGPNESVGVSGSPDSGRRL